MYNNCSSNQNNSYWRFFIIWSKYLWKYITRRKLTADYVLFKNYSLPESFILKKYCDMFVFAAIPTACSSDPCKNGATCTDVTLDTYSCACANNFTGANCDAGNHIIVTDSLVVVSDACDLCTFSDPLQYLTAQNVNKYLPGSSMVLVECVQVLCSLTLNVIF